MGLFGADAAPDALSRRWIGGADPAGRMIGDHEQPFALVVDDDPMILMDACEIVEGAGFTPLEAMTVAAAIAVLEERWSEVSLLFTDVQMPGGRDGFSLAREAAQRWPNIQIIVASGQMKPKPGDLPDGATFIDKPFGAQIVHDRLREVLPHQRQPAPLRKLV